MWLYNDQEFTENHIGSYFGFVYTITNLTNNRKYIGKKYFSKSGRKQIKGKIKKIRKPSDWSNYYGSNDELKNDVRILGTENFKREIIYLCESRSECSYLETYEIFINDALLREDYYNSWVTCKIHKSHVLGKVQKNQVI